MSSALLAVLLGLAACGGGAATGGGGTTTDVVTDQTAVADDAEPLELGLLVRGDTRGARDQITPTCGAARGGGERVFRFSPPENGWYKLHVDAEFDAVLALRVGGGEIGCNDDAETKRDAELVVELEAGRTYEVVVDGYRGGEGEFALVATRTQEAIPAGRQGRLTVDAEATGETTSGTDRHTPSCGSSAGSPDHVWRFTATTAGQYRFHVSASYDSVLAIFDERGTELGCNDDTGQASESDVVLALAAGQSYDVVVDGYRGATGTYRLRATNLSAASAQQPAGGALVVGTTVSGNTTGATDLHTPSCGAQSGSGDNVWSFTPQNAGTYQIHVDSQYDAVLAVMDENGAELACNDDLSTTAQSEVVIGLQAGRTYRVVVDGYGGNFGAYSLFVRPMAGGPGPGPGPGPTPGRPQVAGTLQIGTPISDDTSTGTDQLTPSCGARAGSPDRIWQITPTRRATYRLHVAARYDSVLAIYDSNWIELDCNDDHRSTQESMLRTRLDARQTYYVVVDGFSGGSGSYVLTAARERKPGRTSP